MAYIVSCIKERPKLLKVHIDQTNSLPWWKFRRQMPLLFRFMNENALRSCGVQIELELSMSSIAGGQRPRFTRKWIVLVFHISPKIRRISSKLSQYINEILLSCCMNSHVVILIGYWVLNLWSLEHSGRSALSLCAKLERLGFSYLSKETPDFFQIWSIYQ